ncbi:MAG TPA: hypothetical protein VNF45_08190 [Candidatus Binataceae bacterium]|nr:hypothetical protein [Candidatus Binataceae bacterium]
MFTTGKQRASRETMAAAIRAAFTAALSRLSNRGCAPSAPKLERFGGRVSDSGEGRWTLDAAIDEAVPAQINERALREIPTEIAMLSR